MKTTLFEGSRINVPERSRSVNLNWPFSGSFPDLVAWPVAWPLWSSAVLSVGGAEAAVHCRALRVDALGTFAGDLRDALSVQGLGKKRHKTNRVVEIKEPHKGCL